MPFFQNLTNEASQLEGVAGWFPSAALNWQIVLWLLIRFIYADVSSISNGLGWTVSHTLGLSHGSQHKQKNWET